MLLRLLGRLTPAEAQNRLMRIADREISLSMSYMSDDDRRFVLGMVGRAKALRIREEFGFQRHLAVRYDDYLVAIQNVLRQLENTSPSPPLKSYLRPRNRRYD